MLASSVQAVVACSATAPRVCTLVLFIVTDRQSVFLFTSTVHYAQLTEMLETVSVWWDGIMIIPGHPTLVCNDIRSQSITQSIGWSHSTL